MQLFSGMVLSWQTGSINVVVATKQLCAPTCTGGGVAEVEEKVLGVGVLVMELVMLVQQQQMPQQPVQLHLGLCYACPFETGQSCSTKYTILNHRWLDFAAICVSWQRGLKCQLKSGGTYDLKNTFRAAGVNSSLNKGACL